MNEREQLYSQLPEGMKRCTIVFKECDDGHGSLTVKNWVQHECQICALELANTRIAQLEELIDIAYDHLLGAGYEKDGVTLQKLNLAESSDTWLSDHDKAVEVKVLEDAALVFEKRGEGYEMFTWEVVDEIRCMIESRK
jgi:hypothetical protein